VPELEPLRAEHAAQLWAFERDNREWFAASISDRGDEYFAHFGERLEALLSDQEAGGGAYYVTVADDGTILGRFNLILDGAGGAVLGYRVAQRAAGRGLATECVRKLCALAGTRHSVGTVTASTSHANVASQRVLVKAGFEPVGPADPADVGGKQGTRFRRVLTGAGT
jgi:[ribosomal protein S5]-alanine N-acetyltransferase